MTVSSDQWNGLEIAIIGMSGRFPGARDIDEFWHNLKEGVESISFFSAEELGAEGTDRELLNNPGFVRAAGVMEDAELFDASFFGYSPREAEIIDPQQRVFLECAWEALEQSGYDPDRYAGAIGVYAGARMSTYLMNLYSNSEILSTLNGLQLITTNDKDFLTTRVSYKLNLAGPAVTIQTACSTSLTAVHLACQGLLSGECDIALAGGVAIIAKQKEGYMYREEGIASPDGHCRAFDANARGTVGGNGVGIVVLKRLESALEDGDFIHAVIKGSAINNDGSRKVGFTAPRVEGQALVIRAAQMAADVDPETITYIEAHGTGTGLGDPIEVAALTRAFRASTEKKAFCAMGSVKTNVGHLDAAAGVTGLIKTVLALKHGQIPPSLHFERPNPKIDFANSPVYVNTKLKRWDTNGTARRAGVSSFGMGGTNVHVIVEQAPAFKAAETKRTWHLLPLSAKTASALDLMTANLADHLRKHREINLADAAYTLQVGRKEFKHRRVIICASTDHAVKALETLEPKSCFASEGEPAERPVVFMFPGQGSQYVNMALGLYETEPAFREEFDLCCDLFEPHLGLDLREVLYPGDDQIAHAAQRLKQTAITQPALFAIEYSLARLWMSWGIRPQAMIGHSIGEYVAACLSEVFSLGDAIGLVAARANLMQRLPEGDMLTVSLAEEKVRPLLNDKLSIAAVNAPSLCVVSGPGGAIEELSERLSQEATACHRLHTSHAFHSEMMTPMLGPLTEQVKKIKLNPPRIPYISNVTGTWITEAAATDPGYWAKHARQTVRFGEGMTELLKNPNLILLEVGPGRTLGTLARSNINHGDGQMILSSLPSPNQEEPDAAYLLRSFGRLWLTGVRGDWSQLYAGEKRNRIPLPTYPFERQRYWIELKWSANKRKSLFKKKSDMADWFYIPSWTRSMPPSISEINSNVAQSSPVVVLAGGSGIGTVIAERLKQAGEKVVTVLAGEGFDKISDEVYKINPRRREDYESLFDSLLASEKLPGKIVHEWGVSNNGEQFSGVEFFEKSQQSGFYSLLYLAQALARRNLAQSLADADNVNPLSITIISNGLYEVTGQEELFPEKATILGLCKTIPQEYPNVTCRSIDIAIPENDLRHQRLVDRLVTELLAGPSDLTVAYRGNNRWVQRFEPVRLESQAEPPPVLRRKGVYLITGGLGRDSLMRAKYLAENFQARLVLTGRSGLPSRQDWEDWLSTHDKGDPVSNRIEQVQELERLGAEVLVMAADAASEDQMRSVISRIDEQFGALHGVIHAAGITEAESSRLIHQLSPVECEWHFRPKVYGLYTLERVLEGRSLDFCILTSSLASVSGGAGVSAYTASNIFMDTFAYKHNRASSANWLSLNWVGLPPDETVDAFCRVLRAGAITQLVVCTTDLSARIEEWLHLKSLRQAEEAAPSYARPDLPDPYVAPRNEVEQAIADAWQEVLGIERVGVEDNFFELGGHSLLAIQIISRLRNALQIELPLHTFLASPTVAGLAESIELIRCN